MKITGRQWKRPPRKCPEWCAGGHHCTAQHGHPSGEHRSDPLRWRTRYGRLVATRVETIDGAGRMEVRATVNLTADQELARRQAQQLAVRIDAVIREVMGLPAVPAGKIRPAVQAARQRALQQTDPPAAADTHLAEAERIQRRRTRGWRMPPDAVYVGRPTKFGNPFPVVDGDHAAAAEAYRTWLTELLDQLGPLIREHLAGRDLACWCPLDLLCTSTSYSRSPPS